MALRLNTSARWPHIGANIAMVMAALDCIMPTHAFSRTGSLSPMSSSKNKGNIGKENPNPIIANVSAISKAVKLVFQDFIN
jgi:hypothetical protein